jgi:hypothetical protein
MLGEENSTMMRFLPLEGSEGSLRPYLGLKPKDVLFLRMEGMTRFVSGAGLKKNWRNVPAIEGFSMRGDSGNYKSI